MKSMFITWYYGWGFIIRNNFILFIFLAVLSTGRGEGWVALIVEAKRLKKFADLSALEKKKLLVGYLGIRVDNLFLEEDTTKGDIAGDQQQQNVVVLIRLITFDLVVLNKKGKVMIL